MTVRHAGSAISAPGKAILGSAAGSLVGFYGSTGVSQRSSSNQVTSNLAVSASFGATQLAIIQELMNTVYGSGLGKGS
jgi:hypothetical protein